MPEMFFPSDFGRARKKKKPKKKVVEPGKNPHAVALGKLGGQKGGPARASKLTPYQRSEIARKAALTRWKKKR